MLGKDMINQAVKSVVSQMTNEEKLKLLENLDSKELIEMKNMISKILTAREYEIKTERENYKTLNLNIVGRTKEKNNNDLLVKIYDNNIIIGVNKNEDFVIGALDKNGNVCMLKSNQYSLAPYDSFIGNLCSDCKSLIGSWSEGAKNKGLIISSIRGCSKQEGLYEVLPNEEIPEINALINMAFERQDVKFKSTVKSILDIEEETKNKIK